jgi:hypothetical protein
MFSKHSQRDLKRIKKLLEAGRKVTDKGEDIINSRSYLIVYLRLKTQEKTDTPDYYLPDQELFNKFCRDWLKSPQGIELEDKAPEALVFNEPCVHVKRKRGR